MNLNKILYSGKINQTRTLYYFGIFNNALGSFIRNYSYYKGHNEVGITSSFENANESDSNQSYLNEDPVNDGEDFKVESPRSSKILKAAIVGPPNVGKSTLINQIVGRQVFAISSKVHTTRCRARAVHTEGNTQIVFLDTPGLVSGHESKKHGLEKSFFLDCETSIQEADVIGIVHDVSCERYGSRLDPKVLRLLHFHSNKHCFLVMNKIDRIKSKRTLLDLAQVLTENELKNSKHAKLLKQKNKEWSPQTEFSVDKVIKNQKGWPYFKDIFMVSAIEGDGVGDILEYLLSCAKPGNWLFPKNVFTDQTYVKMIEEIVKARLLDNLPNEVPYNLSTQLEYYDRRPEGTINTVVLVGCKTTRIEKLVMGPGGKRIRTIAKTAEDELRNLFRSPVRLRVVVTKKKDRTVNVDDLVASGSLDVLQSTS